MKITYLVGAGASAKALPIVSQIADRVTTMISYLSDAKLAMTGHYEKEYKMGGNVLSKEDIKVFFVEDLNWLQVIAKSHASIDTYAKKLFLRGDNKNLKKLKLVFSTYLFLEQSLNKVDMRYDSFFASILNDTINSFPKNIRIISWNYDFQFEKSYSEYTENSNIQFNQSYLNVATYYNNRFLLSGGFKIIKLNGTTDFTENNNNNLHQFDNKMQDSLTAQNLSAVLEKYYLLRLDSTEYRINLAFAWEQTKDSEDSSLSIAINETKDTEVLVVIGYSFPYFNREIDRSILKSMTSLKKVYFQSPDAGKIKERFLSVRSDIQDSYLYERTNTDQFLLPDELD